MALAVPLDFDSNSFPLLPSLFSPSSTLSVFLILLPIALEEWAVNGRRFEGDLSIRLITNTSPLKLKDPMEATD